MHNSLLDIYPVREVQSICNLLLEERLNKNRTQLLISENEPLDNAIVSGLNMDLQQLKQSVPVQYVIGYAWFMEMKFKVSPAVLIPRPETEELVNLVMKENRNRDKLNLIDVCSGSGCMAIALKSAFHDAGIRGIDVSREAMAIARENESNLLKEKMIKWEELDVLKEDFLTGEEDIVVSNPPYIPSKDRVYMRDNVLKYEPEIALFTPDLDALVFYKRIISSVLKQSKKNTSCYFECHEEFAQDVADLFSPDAWKETRIIKDLQGKNRMVRSTLIKR